MSEDRETRDTDAEGLAPVDQVCPPRAEAIEMPSALNDAGAIRLLTKAMSEFTSNAEAREVRIEGMFREIVDKIGAEREAWRGAEKKADAALVELGHLKDQVARAKRYLDSIGWDG